jgi:hypothetical protein
LCRAIEIWLALLALDDEDGVLAVALIKKLDGGGRSAVDTNCTMLYSEDAAS